MGMCAGCSKNNVQWGLRAGYSKNKVQRGSQAEESTAGCRTCPSASGGPGMQPRRQRGPAPSLRTGRGGT